MALEDRILPDAPQTSVVLENIICGNVPPKLARSTVASRFHRNPGIPARLVNRRA